MNRIKVNICGKEYSLKTAENASYVLELARELENKINSMVDSGNGVSVQTAAILIALSAMDDARKANESVDNIRTQIKQYVDEAAKAMLERDEALKDKESLKSKLS
ncbi:MAG: cell division protein ZapA, partial [Eubacteriales bacterium]